MDEAERLLAETLALDPLDLWALHLAGRLDPEHGQTEAQTLVDVALESARVGQLRAALELLDRARVSDAEPAAGPDGLRARRRLPHGRGA